MAFGIYAPVTMAMLQSAFRTVHGGVSLNACTTNHVMLKSDYRGSPQSSLRFPPLPASLCNVGDSRHAGPDHYGVLIRHYPDFPVRNDHPNSSPWSASKRQDDRRWQRHNDHAGPNVFSKFVEHSFTPLV
jgi:hypothetical protein